MKKIVRGLCLLLTVSLVLPVAACGKFQADSKDEMCIRDSLFGLITYGFGGRKFAQFRLQIFGHVDENGAFSSRVCDKERLLSLIHIFSIKY